MDVPKGLPVDLKLPDLDSPPFIPHPLLAHKHLMTIVPLYLRPRLPSLGFPSLPRLFRLDKKSEILGHGHWQDVPRACPTIVLIHGFEGSSESHYMRRLAYKGWRAGCNVIRLNQRCCGGTEHLTPTLYNSSLSNDVRTVVQDLAHHDGLPRIWVVGYSMGGNMVLKMAGEAGDSLPALRGVLAICPSLDLKACMEALERPSNWLYQQHFLRSVKTKLKRKALLFPDRYDSRPLVKIRTLREFDNLYTAPDGGFLSAQDYYNRAGAIHVAASIRLPAIIIASQDDPFVPYHTFTDPVMANNPFISVCGQRYGGHCGFVQKPRRNEDCYWAENRIIEAVRLMAGSGDSRSFHGPPRER